MPYLYQADCLLPLRVYYDEDGDRHAVYRLPAPLLWTMQKEPFDPQAIRTQEQVYLVDVYIGVLSQTTRPTALVVPYGPDGQPWYGGMQAFPEVVSYLGVLHRLGYV
ncbi:MAG: hypothetical protein EOO39_35760, partial [Cytophagaceae bacterium]